MAGVNNALTERDPLYKRKKQRFFVAKGDTASDPGIGRLRVTVSGNEGLRRRVAQSASDPCRESS